MRFEIIDFLKGYAIFTIVVFHYLTFLELPQPYSMIIYFGGTGVHLFILMSGFGLYFSNLKKPLSYPSFLKKRFLKIYIPYIVVVLLSALISIYIPVYENSLYALGGHVFLYKMFDESIMGSYGYPLWFISMILQFYLVFYFLVRIKKHLSDVQFVLITLAVSIGWSVFVITTGRESLRIWNSFFLQYLWEFALGMVIAGRIYKSEGDPGIRIKQYYLLIIGLASSAVYGLIAIKGGAIGKMVNDIFVLFGYSLIAIWIYRLSINAVKRFFLFIGNISLSVYLLHTLVLWSLPELFTGLHPVLTVAMALCLTLILSVFYQKAIDRFLAYVKL